MTDRTPDEPQPGPHPTPGPAAAPVPEPQTVPPEPVRTAAPGAFPQVLRTPWINPARRTHVVLVSVLALLVVAAAAFAGGLAAGGDDGGRGRGGPVTCQLAGGPAHRPAVCVGTMCGPLPRCHDARFIPPGQRPGGPHSGAPAKPKASPTPAPSSS
jgi:hypothetical protein